MADKEVYFSRGGGYTRKQLAKNISERRAVSTTFAGLKVENVDTIYEDQLASWEKVKDSHFYYYTFKALEGNTTDEEWVTRPKLDSTFVALFQGKAHDLGFNVINAQDGILDTYEKYEDSTDFVAFGNALLGKSVQLVENCSSIYESPLAIHPKIFSRLSPLQRDQIKKRVEELGRQKPDSYKETLKRYIPRWMYEPIEFSKVNFNEHEWEKLQEELHKDEESDVRILSRKEDLQEGKLPIHLVLKKAKQLEEQGQGDLGYKIRTLGTFELLKMEQVKLRQPEREELPLFHVSLASLASTCARALPKNSYFNFVESYHETFLKTFSRLQRELEDNTPGPAFSFIESLLSIMPEGFEGPLNRSIAEHGLYSNDFDSVALVRLLSEKKPDLAKYFMGSIDEIPERKVYTTSEIEDYASLLTLKEGLDTEQPIDKLLNTEHPTEISKLLSKIGVFTNQGKANIEIATDPATKRVGGYISINKKNTIRHIPFLIDLSKGEEEFFVSTIDDGRLSNATIQKIKDVVSLTIRSETEKPTPQASQKTHSEKPKTIQTQPSPRLTRQQRIEEYEKRKKEEESTKNDTNPKKESQSAFQEEKITGLTRSKIDGFLKEGGISYITIEDFIQRLAQALASSQAKKEPLGARVDVREYGLEFKDIDLREVVFTIDKHSAISVYLKGGAGGVLTLEGTHHKREAALKNSYIQRVLSSIVQNT